MPARVGVYVKKPVAALKYVYIIEIHFHFFTSSDKSGQSILLGVV